MTEGIEKGLIEKGYRPMIMTGEHDGYRIYTDFTKALVNAVLFVDAEKYDEAFFKSFKDSMTIQMKGFGYATHYMTVLVVHSGSDKYLEEMSVSKQVCEDNSFCWIYDETNQELIIYENQAEDFYGLKSILESAKDYVSEAPLTKKDVKKASWKADFKRIPKLTAALVTANVIAFLICTFTGTLLYNKGGAGLALLTDWTQYYRVISYMFLHASISHLFSNMVLLAFLGDVMEKEMKPVSMACMYFLSGIFACLANIVSEMVSGELVVVIGASGAVFGLLGGLFALVMFKRVTSQNMPLGRVLIVILFSLYSGIGQENVANWAHLGGLVTGFLFGVIYCFVTKKVKRGETYED